VQVGSDVVVAQGVVDVLQLPAGCGDSGDVAAAAFGDPVAEQDPPDSSGLTHADIGI
jgi:hypothetical protein